MHTLGIGSGANRTLTRCVARAGGGVEVLLGIGEDVEPSIERLLSRMNQPLVTDVRIEGTNLVGTAPMRLPDLFAGSPALIGVQVSAPGPVTVVGTTADGEFRHQVEVPSLSLGEGSHGVAALYGRERVEDLETLLSARGDAAEIDRSIEDIGLTFQISTRLTSWVAIGEQIERNGPTINQEMPHEVPFGVDPLMAGYGGGGMAMALEEGDLGDADFSTLAAPASIVPQTSRLSLRERAPAPAKLEQLERLASPARAPKKRSSPLARLWWAALLLAMIVALLWWLLS